MYTHFVCFISKTFTSKPKETQFLPFMLSRPEVLNNAQNGAKLKEALTGLSRRQRKERSKRLSYPSFRLGTRATLKCLVKSFGPKDSFWPASHPQWQVCRQKVIPEMGHNKGCFLPFIEWESFVWQAPQQGSVLLKFPANVAIGNAPEKPLLACEINDSGVILESRGEVGIRLVPCNVSIIWPFSANEIYLIRFSFWAKKENLPAQFSIQLP